MLGPRKVEDRLQGQQLTQDSMQDHQFTQGHTQGRHLTKDRTREALYIEDTIQEAHLVVVVTLEVPFTDGIQETLIAMAGTLEVLLVTDKTQIQETQIQGVHVAVAIIRNN